MKRHIRRLRYFFTAFLALFFFGGRPVEFGEEHSFFHGFLIPNPVIKIGLGVNLSDIEINSSSGMKIYEVNKDYRLVSDDAQEVRIKGRREKLTEKFVILVAHAQERKEAEVKAQQLSQELGRRVAIEEDRDELNGPFLLKIGDFLTRGEALAYFKTLDAAGVKDAWIMTEEVTVKESKPVWMLVNDELQSLTEETVLYFIPANQESFLSFNGRSYRGLFILESSRKGMVLVNLLNLEDYLKGVVPNELSPAGSGEIEALKAQAVAARTYAFKNLGEFRELGFDLWDTARSQVYRGIGSELDLSSRAVDETKGEVLLYRGTLINALYTSTCGGRTENSENVFGGKAVPYLRSTVCVYEEKPEQTIRTERPAPARAQAFGQDISLEIASLAALGVIPAGGDPVDFREMAQPEEAAAWIRNARGLLGSRGEAAAFPAPAVTFHSLASFIIQAFHWQDRVQHLLVREEVEYIAGRPPGPADADRRDLAYLIWAEVFPPLEAMGSPDRALSRGELVHSLYRVLVGSPGFIHSGTIENIGRDALQVSEDFRPGRLRLPPDLCLVRDYLEGYSYPASLSLWPGDKARWLERDGAVVLLEVDPSPETNVLDRSSTFHRWQVRRSREELEKLVNQFLPVGRLIDVVDRKRGESGRVIELLVEGGEGQATVTGLKVRTVLGLRDTLFAIDREYDAAGGVSFFTFSGKGWGHGVGLCQVGAIGMAQQGARYQDILEKYYQGVKIHKGY
jgi:stage II sporulation protein D